MYLYKKLDLIIKRKWIGLRINCGKHENDHPNLIIFENHSYEMLNLAKCLT